MSLALGLSSLAVSLTACAGAAVFAIKARAMRIQAEAAADRAEAAVRAIEGLRMIQDLEATRRSYLAEGDPTGRPTHPDGTPYRYSEITAEGWEHCDGCHRWGKWTAEKPHDCSGPLIKGPVAVRPFTSPAEIGAEVNRILNRLHRRGI